MPPIAADPAQCAALAERAAFADRSACGRLRITGADALDLLNRLTTNDLSSLPDGTARSTVLTNGDARVIDHLRLAAADGAIWCIASPGRAEAVAKWIDLYTFGEDVVVEDVSSATAQLAVAGPLAADALSAAGFTVPSLDSVAIWGAPLTHPSDSLSLWERAGVRAASGEGETGGRSGEGETGGESETRGRSVESEARGTGEEDGQRMRGRSGEGEMRGEGAGVVVASPFGAYAAYDVLLPLADVETAKAALRAAVDEADAAAFDAYRIAQGVPAYGAEFGAFNNPLEARLLGSISDEKGCYTGQEVIARLQTYRKVQRLLMAFTATPLADSDVPLADHGSPLADHGSPLADHGDPLADADGSPAGAVTSVCDVGGRMFGLALVAAKHAVAGVTLRLPSGGEVTLAEPAYAARTEGDAN